MSKVSLHNTNVQEAVWLDAYLYLKANAPYYIEAIRADINAGKTPEMIGRIVAFEVGEERAGIAKRVEQAAKHIAFGVFEE